MKKIIYSIRFMFCADFRKPSERSSRENQWDVSLFFDIQLSLGALRFPFFKLTLSLIAVKIVQNCRDKGTSQRINLVLRYSRVVFPSRHSPLLCNLLDSCSPCIRLFSFYFPPRSLPCDLNEGAVFFARVLFKRALNSAG